MEIFIKDDDRVSTVQGRFKEQYPHLQLRFYKVCKNMQYGSPETSLLQPSATLEDIRPFHALGCIDISPSRKVIDVENDFREKFGLNVQIFRQAGNFWLETTQSDNWDLGRQETLGAQSITPKKIELFSLNKDDAEY